MKYYYKNSSSKEPHLVFIGRWCPLHTGHTWIVKETYKKKKLPILILIRDTKFDVLSARKRAKLVKLWMISEKIRGSVIVVPDIEGVYYGRGVGYNIEEIVSTESVQTISATEIRKKIFAKDDSWKDLVESSTVRQTYTYFRPSVFDFFVNKPQKL